MTQETPERDAADSAHHEDGNAENRAGGDAEAAGSVEEREAVARDDDDTWDPDSGNGT